MNGRSVWYNGGNEIITLGVYTSMELLSPAGNREALIAAVENGADAVYLGGKTLNARRGAGNFDDDELKWAADYLHERGKRMYVTVNTVVKQEEMPLLYETASSLAHAGADGAIVQDFGVCQVLGELLPHLPLHASTQMAIHNRQGAAELKKRGFHRAVLAREMTLEQIRACADEGIEIEVFAHGALCVACSGQCLFSSMVGGRSGNRGVCAQPCRLPYRLTGAAEADGYLLSTKDLMTVDMLDCMARAGVTSLKIEGRLKRPEYVAVVTRAYRRALDGECVTEADREALRQIFNRGGFTDGYLQGVVDGTLISRVRPSHWGSRVGMAVSTKKIVLNADVLAQDALAVRTSSGEDVPVKLCGRAGESVANPAGVVGDVMRMVSEEQMAQARESWRETVRTVGVRAEVYIEEGTPARAYVTDGTNTAEATGWTPETARSAVDEARIRAQFEKTGGTPYRMDEVVIHISGQPFAPASGLNALRRDALAALSEKRIMAMRVTDTEVKTPVPHSLPSEGRPERVRLVAQARSAALLAAAKEAGADECAFEPADVRRGALDAQTRGLTEFFLYLPPVMDEKSLSYVNEWAFENDQRIRGVYLTNFGQAGLKWPGAKRYDAALNLANAAAVAFLGAETSVYTPSLELSTKEIEAVGGRRELIVYGRVPLMHLRHCPVNAARGGGRHADCHACDVARAGARTDDSALIDRKRVRFPLSRLAEEGGCVVDVENSVPLSLLKHTGRLPAACGWRMRFTDEDERQVRALTEAFRRLADGGRLNEADAEPERITTGHYFRPVD